MAAPTDPAAILFDPAVLDGARCHRDERTGAVTVARGDQFAAAYSRRHEGWEVLVDVLVVVPGSTQPVKVASVPATDAVRAFYDKAEAIAFKYETIRRNRKQREALDAVAAACKPSGR